MSAVGECLWNNLFDVNMVVGGRPVLVALVNECFEDEQTKCQTGRQLIAAGAKPDVPNYQGKTALHFYCSADLFRILLAAKSRLDLNVCEHESKMTPLGVHARHGRGELCEQLVNARADVNAADVHGDSPLIVAVERGLHAIVACLLAAGADASIKNRKGKTALTVQPDSWISAEDFNRCIELISAHQKAKLVLFCSLLRDFIAFFESPLQLRLESIRTRLGRLPHQPLALLTLAQSNQPQHRCSPI